MTPRPTHVEFILRYRAPVRAATAAETLLANVADRLPGARLSRIDTVQVDGHERVRRRKLR
jgi:hypothetical protein